MVEDAKGAAAPPYTAFQSIKTMMRDMKEHGTPTRIDRTVLTNFSGAVGGQILSALKFLGLTDDNNVPTAQMKALIAAYDTEAWGAELEKVLKSSYAPLFQLNLEAATPGQFTEKFKSAFAGADDVQRKAMTFFLNAIRDTNIKISPYITKNKKPRSNGAPKRRATTLKAGKKTGTGANEPPSPPPGSVNDNTSKTPAEILLSLLSPDMNAAEKNAIWTLIQWFNAKSAKGTKVA